MSHTVEVKTEVRNKATLQAACRALKLAAPVQGTHRLYAGRTAEGMAVTLPGWQYPVVFDTTTGRARLDNYGGAWGNQVELDKLLDRYSAEQVKAIARRKGHTVKEVVLQDGTIEIEVTLPE
jgi:hypothetical protein